MVNIRLKILEAQYVAMAARSDADQRILSRYRQLIAAEHLRTDEATGLDAQLPGFKASVA